MPGFVKANAIVRDPREQQEKDDELRQTTAENLFHIQKQLIAKGTSLENVIAAAAQAHLGHRIQPFVPKKLNEVA